MSFVGRTVYDTREVLCGFLRPVALCNAAATCRNVLGDAARFLSEYWRHYEAATNAASCLRGADGWLYATTPVVVRLSLCLTGRACVVLSKPSLAGLLDVVPPSSADQEGGAPVRFALDVGCLLGEHAQEALLPEYYVGTSAPVYFNRETDGGEGKQCRAPVEVDVRVRHEAAGSVVGLLQGSKIVVTVSDIDALGCCTTIAGSFFRDVPRLSAIDLSPLTRVETIANQFLRGTESLVGVNLSSLTSVTKVGNQFLARSGVTRVDMSTGLCNISAVPPYFLQQTRQLAVVDLTGLTAATTIGSQFLSRSAVNELVWGDTGLSGVTKLDSFFLSETPNIGHLRLDALRSVIQCGDNFLVACGATSVEFGCGLGTLQLVGDSFMGSMPNLTTVSFTNLTALTACGDYFFCHNSTVTSVDLSGLRSLPQVWDGFFSSCTKLEHVDLTFMTNLTACGDCFFEGCGCSTAVFDGLTALQEVGPRFFACTTKLLKAELGCMTAIKSVGRHFFGGSAASPTYSAQLSAALVETSGSAPP